MSSARHPRAEPSDGRRSIVATAELRDGCPDQVRADDVARMTCSAARAVALDDRAAGLLTRILTTLITLFGVAVDRLHRDPRRARRSDRHDAAARRDRRRTSTGCARSTASTSPSSSNSSSGSAACCTGDFGTSISLRQNVLAHRLEPAAGDAGAVRSSRSSSPSFSASRWRSSRRAGAKRRSRPASTSPAASRSPFRTSFGAWR